MSDPYFANVTMLHHFNGTNGSTGPFVDSVGSISCSSVNGAALSTTSPEDGTASLLLVRSSQQRVNLGDSSAVRLGTGDFCIEAWVKLNTLSSTLNKNQLIFGKGAGGNTTFAGYITPSNSIIMMLNNTPVVNGGTARFTSTGVWYHVAFTRSGSTCTVWFNGTSDGTGSSSYDVSSAGTDLLLGYDSSVDTSWYADAYFDEFRITKGVPRYTTNFTPDTSFPSTGDNAGTIVATGTKDTLAIAANVANRVTFALSAAQDTLAMGTSVINRATISKSEAPDTFSATGSSTDIIPITFALTEPSDVASLSLTQILPNVGTFSATEAKDTFTSFGGVPPPPACLVAVGAGGTVIRSSDHGVNWTTIPAFTSATLSSVYQGTSGGLWVAVGTDGSVWSSADTDTWTLRFTASRGLNSVYYNGVTWLAVGETGLLIKSLDGLTWTGSGIATTSSLKRVRYGGGLWVTCGTSGRLYTSPTGAVWTLRSTPAPTLSFFGLNYASGSWTISTNGAFLKSSDGITWSSVAAPTASQKFGVDNGGGLWITSAGPNGGPVAHSVVTKTSTLTAWTTVSVPPFNVVFNDIVYDSQAWVSVGNQDTLGTGKSGVIYSADGTTWVNGTTTATQSLKAVAQGFLPTPSYIFGRISVSEAPDTLSEGITVTATTSGNISATETKDSAVVSGFSNGTLSFTLALTGPSDVASVSINEVFSTVTGDIVSTETPDVAVITGTIISPSVFITVIGNESPDTFDMALSSPITGDLITTEAQDILDMHDTVSGGTTVPVTMLQATLDNIVTYGASLFNGGTLNIYAGAQPIHPSDAPSGTHLAAITLPDPAFDEAADGSAVKVGTWASTAIASGVCGWFRLVSSDGTNSIDGSVSTATGNGNLFMTVTSVTVGDALEVVTANFEIDLDS